MNPVRCFIAVPCFAQQLYCWAAESITNTAIALEKKGWLRQIHYFASSNIVVSRNSLVDIFLKSDCTFILFADGDGSWLSRRTSKT